MRSVHGKPPTGDALLLAMDTASPTVSVAVGRGGTCLARRSVELRRSSENLLRLMDEASSEAGSSLRELDGVLALRGPGSFTGLRVGLSTVLGLHQALGLPATAVPTHEVLAVTARSHRPHDSGPVAAVVDALRGEWFTQVFPSAKPDAPGEPIGPPEVLSPDSLIERLADARAAGRIGSAPAVVVGFGADRLREDPDWPEELTVIEPEALAPDALRLAGGASTGSAWWDPELLTSPLYLRAPAVTRPTERSGRDGLHDGR